MEHNAEYWRSKYHELVALCLPLIDGEAPEWAAAVVAIEEFIAPNHEVAEQHKLAEFMEEKKEAATCGHNGTHVCHCICHREGAEIKHRIPCCHICHECGRRIARAYGIPDIGHLASWSLK